MRNFFFNLGFILTEGFKNIYWRAAVEAAAALLEPDSSSELLYPCFLLQNCPEKKGHECPYEYTHEQATIKG